MSRLNNIIKFVLLNMNILMCFFGSFFIGFACYLWFANWGSLGPSFFIGIGFVSALFGLGLGILSCIGCQGINNQTRKLGNHFSEIAFLHRSSFLWLGFWTGRRIIALHCSCLILGLIGEVYVLRTALDTSEQYSAVYDDLQRGLNPEYAVYESLIAEKFNDFFFGAASTCQSKSFLFLMMSNCL